MPPMIATIGMRKRNGKNVESCIAPPENPVELIRLEPVWNCFTRNNLPGRVL
jgi:hypothetical protein